VAAKHAPIIVNFVEHNKFQILKQFDPARVVRQNPLMQHIRIGYHNVPGGADCSAGIGRRVAVKCEGFNILIKNVHNLLQLYYLIL